MYTANKRVGYQSPVRDMKKKKKKKKGESKNANNSNLYRISYNKVNNNLRFVPAPVHL